jgi:hypothetical protein
MVFEWEKYRYMDKKNLSLQHHGRARLFFSAWWKFVSGQSQRHNLPKAEMYPLSTPPPLFALVSPLHLKPLQNATFAQMKSDKSLKRYNSSLHAQVWLYQNHIAITYSMGYKLHVWTENCHESGKLDNFLSNCTCPVYDIEENAVLQDPDPSMPFGLIRIRACLMAGPGSEHAFWPDQDPSMPFGRTRIRACLLVGSGSEHAFWSDPDPSMPFGRIRTSWVGVGL